MLFKAKKCRSGLKTRCKLKMKTSLRQHRSSRVRKKAKGGEAGQVQEGRNSNPSMWKVGW